MLIKRVRIISADLGTYWYADKIGQEFYVRDEPTRIDMSGRGWRHKVISVGHHFGCPDGRYIQDRDFEVLETFEADIVEETIISIKRMNDE